MPTLAGVGLSRHQDPAAAGREAAAAALDGLGRTADLVLVFATAGYDQDRLLTAVRGCTGTARLAGCSGEGIISSRESIEADHAVGVLAVASDTFTFETVLLEDYARDPARCGRELAARVRADGVGDLAGLIVLPDGLQGDCTRFLGSLNHGLGSGIPVIGGTAADGMTMERTWQYGDDAVVTGAVAAVLLRGGGILQAAVSHGCEPIGLERWITRAEGAWVHEIDDRPAWSVFKEYLDGDPQDLRAEGILHLCVGLPTPAGTGTTGDAPLIIRTPLGLDAERGALYFPGGGLRTGQPIRLTRRDPRRITQGARTCAASILESRPGSRPALVLQFDCAGRGKILFGSGAAEEIVRPLRETLGDGIPWLGFHTYGEIATVGGEAHYHNYTVSLGALYDEP